MSRRGMVIALVTTALLGAAIGLSALYGGWYNVAASEQHWRLTFWVLDVAMRESIRRRSAAVVVPPLDRPGLQRQGLALYDRHCVVCHGGPGVPPRPFALGLRPSPANLAYTGRNWQPADLYWVIRNGIRMTGMPAWEFRLSNDQLWALVAFLKALPALTPLEYQAQVQALAPEPVPKPAALDLPDPAAVAQAALRMAGLVPGERASLPPGTTLEMPGGDPERGRQALLQYACTTCHRIPGVVGAAAPVGPPLEGLGRRGILAGVLVNTPENMVLWLRASRHLDPRTAMPELGVSERDARDMAAYLYQR